MMHIAFVIDAERLLHEREMLMRASAGLRDMQHKITWYISEEVAGNDDWFPSDELREIRRLPFARQVVPWQRRDRAERLLERSGRTAIDIVYGIGTDAWPAALSLAEAAECPAAVDLWSLAQVRKLPKPGDRSPLGGYIAATRGLAQAAAERVPSDLVAIVPFGVEAATEPAHAPPRSEAVCLAAIGAGRDFASYRAMLEGLAGLELPNLQVFLELRGDHGHDIWREAKRLDLLDTISSITDAAHFRALVTQCNALLHPERFSEMRSLLLEAMMEGMPIVTARDDRLEMLTPQTALVVEKTEADDWRRALETTLTANETTAALTAQAKRYAMSHHTTERQVTELERVLERIARGGAYAFLDAPTSDMS